MTENIDEKAIARGWRPQEEWEGEPSDWVDSAEFLRRGELMDTISTLNKRDKQREEKLATMEAALKQMGEHNKKIAEKEYERAMKELKRQKTDALEAYDSEKVVELDDKINDLKESKRALDEAEVASKQPQRTGPHPIFVDWVNRNPWYNDNLVMRGAADALGKNYCELHPEAVNNPEEVLKYVDSKMKENFPTRQRPAATTEGTEGTSGKSATKRKASPSRLTEEQRKFGKTFVEQGLFADLSEYAEQLDLLGELK